MYKGIGGELGRTMLMKCLNPFIRLLLDISRCCVEFVFDPQSGRRKAMEGGHIGCGGDGFAMMNYYNNIKLRTMQKKNYQFPCPNRGLPPWCACHVSAASTARLAIERPFNPRCRAPRYTTRPACIYTLKLSRILDAIN